MKARTIQLGSYRMDITVESNHYEKNGDAWEGTVDQSAAWYSVEYKLYIDGKILRGTTYFGKDALKLQRGVPAGACGLVRLEGNGKSVPLYLTAENAELVEKTVRDLEAEASDPETDRIIKEKAEEALAAQRGHYKRIKDFGEKEIACNGHLMTRAEVKAFQKSWNKIENEGADGYMPRFIAKEDYDEATQWLANNR